jgi:hypothetical protein
MWQKEEVVEKLATQPESIVVNFQLDNTNLASARAFKQSLYLLPLVRRMSYLREAEQLILEHDEQYRRVTHE